MSKSTPAPATIEAPADLREYATLGAAMEIDRMFAALPVLYRAVVATKPGQSVTATVAQAIAEQNADPNGNGIEQPEQHPEQPEQRPHTPRPPAKHPRGKQRNPATHRSPRGHHKPPKRRTRAPLTAAARKAISERMRQYWAQRRMH
jgi:hypothetical protein